MSRGHQLFVATGHLGDAPSVKAPQTGGLIAELRIAVTETWADKAGEKHEHTEWLRVKLFGRKAEIAQQYLVKGSLVTIEGKIHTEKWQAADGTTKYGQWIYAQELRMHGGRDHETTKREHQGRAPAAAGALPADEQYGDDDLPF